MATTISSERTSIHGMWTSRLAFILAATGSAVGLGNIWRFPYLAGENGGGAFVLVYLGCVLLIGIPIMMAEFMIGRRGRRNPVDAMRIIAEEEGLSPNWAWVGRVAVIAGFLILSFCSVFAGWILAYMFRMGGGAFTGADVVSVAATFDGLISDPERSLLWHTIFIVIVVGIVMRGVEHGLEKAVKYMVPSLFAILLLLLGYTMTLPTFLDGMKFMLVPDFGKLSGDSILVAMGMAFFSLSLGMGAIMMYGSYLPKEISIPKTTAVIALLDTSVSLIAGLCVFPIVFASGLDPAMGFELVFKTLPLAFQQMPVGVLVGTLFFILLSFAAITAAISLLEPAVAWLVENRNMERAQAARFSGAVAWLLGLGTVFSFNLWADYKWTFRFDLGKVQYVLFKNKSFFDVIDFLTANLMLPLAGLLIALFVAHLIKRESCEDELSMNPRHFNVWYFILRNISPIAVGIILLSLLGVFDFLGIS